MLDRIPLFGLGDAGKSVNIHAQKRVNLYCQVEKDDEKTKISIFPTPGLVSFVNFGANPCRALYAKGDYLYAVNGSTFWRVANDGTQTNVGTLLTSGGRCDVSDNGQQIMIVDGENGYVYSLASAQTISSNTHVGAVATVITASSHGLSTGMQVTVSGASPALYNGTYTITVVDGVTFTYTMAANPGSDASPAGSYTIANAFTSVPSFPGGSTITFLNGYFIVNVPGNGQWNISGLYDGYSWDALDFANAESDPDDLVRVMADNGQIVLLGQKTTEFWADSGAADFPFARIGASAIEWGLAARWSLCKFMDSLIFLRRNRLGQVQICTLSGYRADPVSTPELEYEISTYSAVEDATGFAYMKAGHPFYQINFPSAGKSWLFDGQNGSWTEVRSSDGRHRGEIQQNYLNDSYVTDYQNGKVYRFDEAVYTDDGEPIEREWISRHQGVGDYSTLSQLWIEMESGVGLISGQGSTPQLMMSISRDGGHTYGAEVVRDFGAIGEYKYRAVFNRIGRARDWLFKFRISDPVKTVFVAAWGRYGR